MEGDGNRRGENPIPFFSMDNVKETNFLNQNFKPNF